MKKHLITVGIIVSIVFLWALIARGCMYKPSTVGEKIIRLQEDNVLQDGDIIFQISKSAQSEAIQQATHSKYSHCGIIFKQDNKYFVYEAIEPVVKTQLNHWINRGKDSHYVVKRLKDGDKILTEEVRNKMLEEAKKHFGKHYDLSFSWSDDKMYCSELVWKIFERGADIEVGTLEELRDFDLSHPVVQQKINERFGKDVPMDEVVISPASIFESDKLYTVTKN